MSSAVLLEKQSVLTLGERFFGVLEQWLGVMWVEVLDGMLGGGLWGAVLVAVLEDVLEVPWPVMVMAAAMGES